MKIPSRIRYFNKKFTNRLMIKIAGRPHSPIALIRHLGRKTGSCYETPIIAEKDENHFIFALTYGKDVDWFRNILAHKSGELLWKGRWYRLENPQPLDARAGSKAFAQPMGAILCVINIQDYFSMEISELAG